MFCTHCGKEISESEIFCPFCGVRLQPEETIEPEPEPPVEPLEEPPRAPEPPKSKSNKTVIIAIVVAAVVVAGAIAAFALLSGPKQRALPADTTPPEISVLQTTINEGEVFNIGDFVSIEDDVDGPMNEQDFTVEGDVDTDVPGTYDISVTVSDLAGNTATRDLTVEVIQQEGSEAAFVKKITGLWLNGSQSANDAKQVAHNLGLTDVSMTEFVLSGDRCMMTTWGDVDGEFDGVEVPDITDGVIYFSHISPDLCTAEGTVNGMDIYFDLGTPDDQVISFTCDGYFTYCAYTGFSTAYNMFDYLDELYEE